MASARGGNALTGNWTLSEGHEVKNGAGGLLRK